MARKKKENSFLDISDPQAARQALKEQLNNEAGGLLITSLKEEAIKGIDVISTGIPSLDIALGVGGVPKGRITEIYGPNQAGKTTLALQIAANAYKAGDVVLYVDAETSLDPKYCENLGLNVKDEDKFILMQPDFGEQALNGIYDYVRYGLVDLVIIDSVAALTPSSTLHTVDESGFEKARLGEQARMITKFLGIVTSQIKKKNVCIVMLNQIRTKITPIGAREGRLGGHALMHCTSVVIDVRRTGPEGEIGKKDSELYGIDGGFTKAHVKKNKVGPPHRQSLFTIKFGEGADYFANLINTCDRYGVGIEKNGTWYIFVDDEGTVIDKIQGINSAAIKLRGEKELVTSLVEQLSVACGVNIYNPFEPEKPIGPIDGITLSNNIGTDIFSGSPDSEDDEGAPEPNGETNLIVKAL